MSTRARVVTKEPFESPKVRISSLIRDVDTIRCNPEGVCKVLETLNVRNMGEMIDIMISGLTKAPYNRVTDKILGANYLILTHNTPHTPSLKK